MMHGERDHLVPLDVGMEHIEIFEESGWPVTRLEHEKGHMVNLNQFEEMREQVSKIAKILKDSQSDDRIPRQISGNPALSQKPQEQFYGLSR